MKNEFMDGARWESKAMKNEFYAQVISNTHCLKALEVEAAYWERRGKMIAKDIERARSNITKPTIKQLSVMGRMAEYVSSMAMIVRYRKGFVGNDTKLV